MNQIHLEKLKKISRFGQRLWTDSSGFVVSGEYILLTTLLVIGMVVGVVTFRDQIVQEFGDVSDAMESLNQSYTYTIVDPTDPNIVILTVEFDEDNPPDPPPPPDFPDPTGESGGPGSGQSPAGISIQEPADTE